jgi:hypothetical protein
LNDAHQKADRTTPGDRDSPDDINHDRILWFCVTPRPHTSLMKPDTKRLTFLYLERNIVSRRLWFQSSLGDWYGVHGCILKYTYVDISLSREEHNFFLLAWDILDCRSDKLWGKSSIGDIGPICSNIYPSSEFDMILLPKFCKTTQLYLKTTIVSCEYETENAHVDSSQKWDPSQSPTIIHRRWLNR